MNKRISFLFFVCTITVHAFALKIPTGDNIRAVDAKEDEDAIVEVIIGGEENPDITTPLGKLKAKVGSTLYFYKSGALKEIYCTNNGKIETEIGSFIPYRECTFYESGSLKSLLIYDNTVFTIGGTLYGIKAYKNLMAGEWHKIEFYDSGNTEKFLVKKIDATSYNIDEEEIEKITYTNKSGTFIFQLDGIITFFMDGTIETAKLASSPNQPALVNNEEVFIASNASKYDGHPAPITFYEDGSIASFVSDELCMTKQGDTKLNIPAQTRIELWESGIIKKCACSNEITVKMKSYTNEYTTICYFNKDGSIRAVQVGNYDFADTFYEDGSIKRKVKWNGNKFYVEWLNPKGILVDDFHDFLVYHNYSRYFYPKDGDYASDVAMVYFDDSGTPSSYSVFKKDDKGNIITDEFGFPLCEEEKKKLLNQEEKNEEEKKKRSK
ncbi:MAG: hypothetical protein MR555_02175 [Spirochaetia bacterium]|nr:hypothetical protein [Spirochaetia bacterium]